jgi:hypothetical protein
LEGVSAQTIHISAVASMQTVHDVDRGNTHVPGVRPTWVWNILHFVPKDEMSLPSGFSFNLLISS